MESDYADYCDSDFSKKRGKVVEGRTSDLYYTNFSKYVLDVNVPKKTIEVYSHSKWKMNSNEIERISLQVLKNSLRHNNCRVSGNKETLINRLRVYYLKIDKVVDIQRIFRGFLVRECECMRGPASKDYTICNNTTDFQTMESFAVLPRERFFSYRDANGFVYGFDIFSLMTMFRCKRKFVNPYNREDMPFYAVQSLISIYKKTLLLYPDVLAEKDGEVIDVSRHRPYSRLSEERSPDLNAATSNNNIRREENNDDEDDEDNEEPDDEYLTTASNSAVSSLSNYVEEPTLPTNIPIMNIEYQENYKIRNIRESSVIVFERIQLLIDGESNPEWFLQLTKNECDRFYRFYHIWWTRSSTLSEYVKNSICGIQNPFSALNRLDENNTEEFYKSICLDVIEAMVYTGIDDYYCTLGATQVLTMLTLVSRPTRRVWQELFNDFY